MRKKSAPFDGRNSKQRETKRLTLRLEIPVDEPHQTQVLESSDDLSSVESGVLLRQTFSWTSLESSEELASHAVLEKGTSFVSGPVVGEKTESQEDGTNLHAKEKMVFRLEGMEERDDEGMIRGREDFLIETKGRGQNELVGKKRGRKGSSPAQPMLS